MEYRPDHNLDFLSELNSEDLNDLVYCLTHDKDGETRWTEMLTTDDLYKQHYPDHSKYWRSIASEVQCFGANTFATIFRGGQGVMYKEVLEDVCNKLEVNFNNNSSVEKIEQHLLMKVLEEAIENMSSEEVQKLVREVGLKNTANIGKEALIAIFQGIFRAGGFKSYQLTLIIANGILKALIGRGLSLAGNAALTKTMSILTGPIGWVITGLWTAIDIAGTAYRVTIPAVIQIAVLRQKHLYESKVDEIEFS